MGDWNASLDPKIDKVRRGASGFDRCESRFMARYDLVDRFHQDHTRREMGT